MDVGSSTYIPRYAQTPLSESDEEISKRKELIEKKNWANISNTNVDYSKKLENMPRGIFNSTNESDAIKDAKAKLKNASSINLNDLANEEYDKFAKREEIASLNPDYAYWQFDSFIDNIKGLSKEDTDVIKNSVLTAIDSNYTLKNDNGYSMTMAQTNFELKFISKNLIPEQYQEDFNSLVEKYTEDLAKNDDAVYENLAKAFASYKDPDSLKMGLPEAGKKMLEELKNGTYKTQTARRIYKGLYENIGKSDLTNVKENLDSVYNDYIENGMTYENGDAAKGSFTSEVMNLKEKWNSLIYAMGYSKNLMLKTSINNLA